MEMQDISGKDGYMQWWRDSKIGMFIHWGPYAALWKTEYQRDPGFAAEWGRHTLRVPGKEYHEIAKRWNPCRFDADAVAGLAKDAGMKYMIFTSKHHDGFCMFDSKLTDFKITNSEMGRDVARELSDACAKTGIQMGFYYSPRDWDHPDYLPHYDHNDHPGPRYGGWWGHFPGSLTGRKVVRNLHGGPETHVEGGDFLDCGCSACKANRPIVDDRDESKADFHRYLQYQYGQIDELLSDYGDVKVLWFDGQEHCPEAAGTDAFLQKIREKKNGIIVNDRIGTDGYLADFGVAESYIPETGEVRDWEACLTMAFSWGYEKDAHTFFTPADIIRQVVEVVSKGGNILINISPDEMGLVPEYQEERLRILGRWLARFGDAIYGTRRVGLKGPKGMCFTRKGEDLYVIQTESTGSDLWIPGLMLKENATVELLGCNHPVRWQHPDHLSVSTRRSMYNDADCSWPEIPEHGLHIRVGEIPSIHWYGEPALAFKITGAKIEF